MFAFCYTTNQDYTDNYQMLDNKLVEKITEIYNQQRKRQKQCLSQYSRIIADVIDTNFTQNDRIHVRHRFVSIKFTNLLIILFASRTHHIDNKEIIILNRTYL